jgi:hypothetical protein
MKKILTEKISVSIFLKEFIQNAVAFLTTAFLFFIILYLQKIQTYFINNPSLIPTV